MNEEAEENKHQKGGFLAAFSPSLNNHKTSDQLLCPRQRAMLEVILQNARS
jgi:hypothetical protein